MRRLVKFSILSSTAWQKNKQITNILLVQTIDNALGEIAVDFEDDEEEGEDILADMIILQKMWSYCYHENCSL